MALADYNGWRGFVRERRNPAYYAALKSGAINVGETCLVCGVHNSTMIVSPHSEEYGSTMENYIKACIPLCVRCHGVIHVRASYPLVFETYKRRLRNGDKLKLYPNMMAVFGHIFRTHEKFTGDWDSIQHEESGTWLDTLAMGRYKDHDKIAIAHGRGMREIPDPVVYGMSWSEPLSGYIVGDTTRLVTFYRNEKNEVICEELS